MNKEKVFAYDEVIYPSYLHTQTHPDRLATLTKFFGMNPTPVEKCRVLELGCGIASSLLSFAFDLSESEFIGIDLSEKQIEIGKMAVEAAGLKNLTLRHYNIMDVTREEFGEFDYIIVHGIYSWVPEPVRDQIFKVCRELLTPQGVAFVSYNAYPGAAFRNILRGMIVYHTRNITAPNEKVQEAMSFLNTMKDIIPSNAIHRDVVKIEVERLNGRNPENIYHDELETINHPVYFYEFAAHAQEYGLQFVTEAEHFHGKTPDFKKEIIDIFGQPKDDVVAYEQYSDFLIFRRFRQSLLCQEEIKLKSAPDPQTIRELRIATSLTPESTKPELSTAKHEVFLGEKKERVEIAHPLTKAALYHLGKVWARSETFDDLVAASRQLLNEENSSEVEISEDDENILIEILFRIFSSGLVALRTHEPAYTTQVSEKPMASPIARWQAGQSFAVSTLLSTGIHLEEQLGIELLKLLDGTRNHQQIADDLTKFVNSPEFEQPDETKKMMVNEINEKLEANLQRFANLALLVS